ncbi:hypothetical protein J8L86_12590 [Shewanella sp. MMG014]|uniref:hypothetical protein n=1 Tax=unclassified Shewanella TaxID=196818 RepID=UPI0006D65F5A|nr:MULTISPECIES: hypothetical protein [unclassified Shewanella]KPZ73130.1 hypothetical protein AN944_00278 [Shewanella sp. P1-14-1]MBQ4890690.1 hypothetical protein [Shewanella sp. MMG014]
MKYLLLFLIIFTPLVQANCVPHGCFGVEVEKLYIKASGMVYIATSGDETLMDCSAVSGVYSTLSPTDPGINRIYSTLLAAQMAGKKVSVRTVNSSNVCQISYVTIDKQ